MTLARTATQLDPATELEDFQSRSPHAAHSRSGHRAIPAPGVLALVRRFEEPLRTRVRPVVPLAARCSPTECPAAAPAARVVATDQRARRLSHDEPFSPQTYASLCLLLGGTRGARRANDHHPARRRGRPPPSRRRRPSFRSDHRTRPSCCSSTPSRGSSSVVCSGCSTAAPRPSLPPVVTPSTTSTVTRPAGCLCHRPASSPH